METQNITLTISLEQAAALSTSVGKTLAAEAAKMKRNGKGHVISRQAAINWRLLDDVDNQLRQEMQEGYGDYE